MVTLPQTGRPSGVTRGTAAAGSGATGGALAVGGGGLVAAATAAGSAVMGAGAAVDPQAASDQAATARRGRVEVRRRACGITPFNVRGPLLFSPCQRKRRHGALFGNWRSLEFSPLPGYSSSRAS